MIDQKPLPASGTIHFVYLGWVLMGQDLNRMMFDPELSSIEDLAYSLTICMEKAHVDMSSRECYRLSHLIDRVLKGIVSMISVFLTLSFDGCIRRMVLLGVRMTMLVTRTVSIYWNQ